MEYLEVENNEADEAAERQKRLQKLRSKQREKPAKPMRGAAGGAGEGEGSDRKREIIKNIMKKRMQEGGASQGGNAKKGMLKRAMKKKPGSGDAGKFPRLKALLEQRGGQGETESPVDIAELEARVTRLEQALEKALEMFESETK